MFIALDPLGTPLEESQHIPIHSELYSMNYVRAKLVYNMS